MIMNLLSEREDGEDCLLTADLLCFVLCCVETEFEIKIDEI